jgi:4-amino-4-deoxy-L-arabinose transferase-like glycosyltransferase
VALLLALMALLEWTSALQESQTYDEAMHLAAGYSYLTTGDFHRNPEHPPLSKLLAALPLLLWRPILPTEDPAWGGDQRMFGAAFLYRNRVDGIAMLTAGRCVTMAASLVLGLALAVWTRRRFGMAASLLALLLYALDANVLAHGRYVTNDVLTALLCFLAVTAWAAYLEQAGRSRLLLAGLFLGLALGTKFSAVFLLPVYVILWWIHRPRSAPAMAVVGAIAALTVASLYGPETLRILRHPGSVPQLADSIQHGTAPGKLLYAVARTLRLPAHSYLVGLESAARHDRIGHPSYLLGQLGQDGWWYYFPVAFAVKAPAALLLLTLASAAIGLRRILRRRAAGFHWQALLVPLIIYAALTINSRLNIGYRHLLPAYPFLLAAIAGTIASVLHGRRLAAAACAIAVLHVSEAARIYPHHLAFFNLFAGGPARGPEYLLDSNLDWGQDLLHLQQWRSEHGNPRVCLEYFGTADTERYGLARNGLPKTWDAAGRGSLDCVGAISVNLLHGLYIEPGAYQWLQERRPIGHAGWSIYLYDLRR